MAGLDFSGQLAEDLCPDCFFELELALVRKLTEVRDFNYSSSFLVQLSRTIEG